MIRFFLTGLLTATTFFVFGQNIEAILSSKEVERIEKTLSADDMRGRRAFTADIEKAADFIAEEFRKAGLQSPPGNPNFKQKFTMITPKFTGGTCSLGNQPVDFKNVVVITCRSQLAIDEKSGYEKIKLEAGKNLIIEAQRLIQSGKNYLVLVDTSYSKNFNRLTLLKRSLFKIENSVVFVLTTDIPSVFSITAQHEITEHPLTNVLGVLPGKSKKDQVVIFSAHYDHIGVGKPVKGDSIYNGANDDASGTTAVIMLAKYFQALNNHERTLVFAAFTAEEMGGVGSQYFSRQFDPEKVIAMVNIEMIGTESKWGKNAAYVTGYDITNMGAILQKNLNGTGFTLYPDPYPEQNLFYRSDNATLARLGVPAHTISTAKMDREPHYHQVSDQFETLDIENMSRIIQSIALASRSIVEGKDMPTRQKREE